MKNILKIVEFASSIEPTKTRHITVEFSTSTMVLRVQLWNNQPIKLIYEYKYGNIYRMPFVDIMRKLAALKADMDAERLSYEQT